MFNRSLGLTCLLGLFKEIWVFRFYGIHGQIPSKNFLKESNKSLESESESTLNFGVKYQRRA